MFDAINPASGPVAKDFTLPISRRPGAGNKEPRTGRMSRGRLYSPPTRGRTLRDMILVSKSLVPAALLRGARAAALALIALAWLASPGAQAQTGGTRVSDVLVSNTGQSDIAGISVGKYLYAQPFNTGDHGGGYHLAGVVLDFGAAPSAAAGTITVTVREDSSGNPSGNVLYTLINPAFSVGSNEFPRLSMRN